MAKVVKKAAPKTDQDLNRWCIEMAIRWPVVTEYGNSGVYAAGGGHYPRSSDADVIGRAKKLRAWVTSGS